MFTFTSSNAHCLIPPVLHERLGKYDPGCCDAAVDLAEVCDNVVESARQLLEIRDVRPTRSYASEAFSWNIEAFGKADLSKSSFLLNVLIEFNLRIWVLLLQFGIIWMRRCQRVEDGNVPSGLYASSC